MKREHSLAYDSHEFKSHIITDHLWALEQVFNFCKPQFSDLHGENNYAFQSTVG